METYLITYATLGQHDHTPFLTWRRRALTITPDQIGGPILKEVMNQSFWSAMLEHGKILVLEVKIGKLTKETISVVLAAGTKEEVLTECFIGDENILPMPVYLPRVREMTV